MIRNQWDYQHGDDDPEYVTMHAQRYQSALSEPAWTPDEGAGYKPSWSSSPVDRARYMLAEMMEQAESAPTPLALPVIRALHTDLESTLRRVTQVGHLMAYGSPEEVHSQSLSAVQSALGASCPRRPRALGVMECLTHTHTHTPSPWPSVPAQRSPPAGDGAAGPRLLLRVA